MLQVLTKFICFLIMHMAGYYIINRISDRKPIIDKKTLLHIIITAAIVISIHSVQYTPMYSIIIFLLNIVVYKQIFKLEWNQAIIATSLFTIILIPADILVTTILRTLLTQEQIRAEIFPSILANAMIATTSVLLLNIKFILKLVKKFYTNFSKKKVFSETIFFILIIIGFGFLAYNFATYNITDQNYFANIVAVIIFITVDIIYIQSKNKYKTLSDEYDNLFNYVQNFEEWIEKEQLNRHEYKNQLAVLRTIAKDKKVINKIDEILEDNINIEGEVVSQLKDLPKGGLKGLIYYKVAIAQKKKIKLIVDISLKSKSYLQKLSENQIKDICKLIGIYFDNAIEAAEKTKEKYVLLEIYDLSDKVNIVISNTFKESDNLDNKHEKGITSKGEGHGYGLYFANKIVSKNKMIESNQEVVEKYYIQTISIKKD